MPLTNTATPILSYKEACRQARVNKAFADPNRLHILHLLKQQGGNISVNEIVKESGLEQSMVSFHLKLLLKVGLVSYRKDGRTVFYTIEAQKLTEVCMAIHDLIPEKKEQPHAH